MLRTVPPLACKNTSHSTWVHMAPPAASQVGPTLITFKEFTINYIYELPACGSASTANRDSIPICRDGSKGVLEHLKYADSHEWVDVDGTSGKIGITDHAQDHLGDVVYVELPEVGATVSKGKNFGVVESVKATSDVYSPVSGEVIEVNTELSHSPGLSSADLADNPAAFETRSSEVSWSHLLDDENRSNPKRYASEISAREESACIFLAQEDSPSSKVNPASRNFEPNPPPEGLSLCYRDPHDAPPNNPFLLLGDVIPQLRSKRSPPPGFCAANPSEIQEMPDREKCGSTAFDTFSGIVNRTSKSMQRSEVLYELGDELLAKNVLKESTLDFEEPIDEMNHSHALDRTQPCSSPAASHRATTGEEEDSPENRENGVEATSA
ncbi:hypothetical protein KSP40_PGU006817 [Platanthera guangdongensis]|uniref:Lipoyl-binding domain-containing protein n=1 Tax=Platanthera guangdongensis TaxID=2320717 RepID=A0ABR2M790_9ASPA